VSAAADNVNSKGVEVKAFLSSWNENKASFKMSTGVDPWLEPLRKPDANIRPPVKLVPVMLYSTEESAAALVHVPPVVVPDATTRQE
jgi:hypothetical protein